MLRSVHTVTEVSTKVRCIRLCNHANWEYEELDRFKSRGFLFSRATIVISDRLYTSSFLKIPYHAMPCSHQKARSVKALELRDPKCPVMWAILLFSLLITLLSTLLSAHHTHHNLSLSSHLISPRHDSSHPSSSLIFLLATSRPCHRLNPAPVSASVHSISTPFSSLIYTSAHTLFNRSSTRLYSLSHSFSTVATSRCASASSSASPKCFSIRLRRVSIPRRIEGPSWAASSFLAAEREWEGLEAIEGPGECLRSVSVDSTKSCLQSAWLAFDDLREDC